MTCDPWKSTLRSPLKLSWNGLVCFSPIGFDIHYNARLEGRNFAPDKELAYALVVSVQAKKISDLYDTIVRKFAALIEPLRPVVEIPITI